MSDARAPDGATAVPSELSDVLGWSPVASIVLDGEGWVRFANPAAEELLGDRTSLVGTRPFPAVGHDGSPEVAASIGSLAIGRLGATARHTVAWRDPAGHRRWLDLRLVRIGDVPSLPQGVLVHLDDVTAAHDVAAALAAAEEESRTAFEAAPIGMAILSLDGWLLTVNGELARIVGRRESTLLATRLADLVVADDRSSDALGALLAGDGDAPVVLRLRGTRGAVRVRAVTRPVRRPDGTPRHLILQLEDVTARLAVEEELHRTLAELERSNAELEAFAHVAAHDLRSPLASVRGMIEAVRMTGSQLDDTAGQLLDRALAGTDRMDALVLDLLSYAAVTRDADAATEVDLGRVLEQALALLEGLVDREAASIEVGPLPVIRGRRAALAQLFQNLLGNGLKFHRPGEAPRLSVTASRADEVWVIRIADHGVGIPAADRDRIFQPFTRLHGRDRFEGTGVGLAICRRVVESHAGAIRVEETPGGGSTFVVELPAT